MDLISNATRHKFVFLAIVLFAVAWMNQVASAGTYTVINANSTDTGSFDQALRNVNQAGAGPHRITFDSDFFNVAREIVIDGRYSVVNEFTIEGPGSDLLTVVVVPRNITNAATRDLFFGEWAGSSPPTLTVQGLTFEIGSATGLAKRLFFLTNIDLFLKDVHMQGNVQRLTSQSGSGIVIQNASLLMEDCMMSNFVADANGGAVYVNNTNDFTEEVIVQRSVFTGNTVTAGGGNGFGGSIFVHGGGAPGTSTSVELIDSEISDSLAETTGGGIAVLDEASLVVHNSTISSNSADNSSGGGIFYTGNRPLNIQFSTIVDNFSSLGPAIDTSFQQSIQVMNSIVAGNFGSAGPEIVGSVLAAHALIGDGAGDADMTNTTEASGFSGTLIFDTDPMLGGLSNSGGFSRTHAPRSDSPVLDVGDSRAVPVGSPFSLPTFDQRGASFDRVSGPGLDIGAHEVQVAAPPTGGGGGGGGGGGSMSIWLLGLLSLAQRWRVRMLKPDRG